MEIHLNERKQFILTANDDLWKRTVEIISRVTAFLYKTLLTFAISKLQLGFLYKTLLTFTISKLQLGFLSKTLLTFTTSKFILRVPHLRIFTSMLPCPLFVLMSGPAENVMSSLWSHSFHFIFSFNWFSLAASLRSL